ncbi:hypothetical protein [Streptomyces venezuelae]|uniref:hypothetical protein n=1 Tax=Streptomyces venezuelae TaxID=54571 RepID=UPI0037B3A8C9
MPRSRPRHGHRTTAPPGAVAWPVPARPASRPVTLTLTGALFAVAAYHLVLGPVPGWDARTVAAAVLFHTALSLRLALPQDETRRTRWAAVRGRCGPGTRAPASATAARPLGGGSLTRTLRLLWAFLARLLRPFRTPRALAPPPAVATHRPARAAHTLPLPVLLADALVRRGPPACPPLTV